MSISKLIGNNIIKGDGKKIDNVDEHFKDKIVGLYFSAHWCPPCRGFTPLLAEKYNELVQANKGFEIVFVSSDQDQNAFDHYFGEQPWTALAFDDRNTKSNLSQQFKVQGIPTLVILDGNGQLISTSGRMDVYKNKDDITKAYDTWAAKIKK